MSALDLLDDSFPHGTVAGYRNGCRGSQCPAPMTCRDVHTRYAGDFGFKRLVDAGVSVADILARDTAEREGAAERDRVAARVERVKTAAPVKRVRMAREPRPRVSRVAREKTIERLGPEITRLNGEGQNDRQIADALGLSPNWTATLRRELGLPARQRVRRERPPRTPRHDRRADVIRLHAEGMRDVEIADALGLKVGYIGGLRRGLGLETHLLPRAGTPRPAGFTPHIDRRPEVGAAHAEGLTDAQISDRIGISRSEVGRLRRDLNLQPNYGPPTPRKPETLMPHGTNASYARGCRCDDCHQAQRVYYREWHRKKRTEGIPAEHHGTPYGYQLGCRGRSACPAETSCTDAMLEEDRRRRREAGIQQAPPRVDAEPVRAHARALVDGGMSVHQVAETAGVSLSGLKTLLYGRSGARRGEYPAQVETEKARRILALERTS